MLINEQVSPLDGVCSLHFRIITYQTNNVFFYLSVCYLLNKGVYGIIGVSNASALSTIQSYSNTFQVPFLALSMAQNSSYHSPFQLFMRPMYVKGILDVITNYRWTHLLYVYDTDEGKNIS